MIENGVTWRLHIISMNQTIIPFYRWHHFLKWYSNIFPISTSYKECTGEWEFRFLLRIVGHYNVVNIGWNWNTTPLPGEPHGMSHSWRCFFTSKYDHCTYHLLNEQSYKELSKKVQDHQIFYEIPKRYAS